MCQYIKLKCKQIFYQLSIYDNIKSEYKILFIFKINLFHLNVIIKLLFLNEQY
jgi:hypothetical protein